MKTKQIRIAMAAVVVAAAGYGIYLNQGRGHVISALALVKAEALADNEAIRVQPCFVIDN